MSASLLLSKRKQNPQFWGIGNPDAPLGMWDGVYVTSGSHPCVPGFTTVPIGNPYGAKMCVRRQQKPLPQKKKEMADGINRYSADLYDSSKKEAVQEWNPIAYNDRTPPNLPYLISNDYISRPINYNGTGVRLVHTPVTSPLNEGKDQVNADTHYYEYGYSYLNSPPYKYDVTRYQQPYPVWRSEQNYGPNPQHSLKSLDQLDQIYNTQVI